MSNIFKTQIQTKYVGTLSYIDLNSAGPVSEYTNYVYSNDPNPNSSLLEADRIPLGILIKTKSNFDCNDIISITNIDIAVQGGTMQTFTDVGFVGDAFTYLPITNSSSTEETKSIYISITFSDPNGNFWISGQMNFYFVYLVTKLNI
jgi:hypothetical protein